MIDNILLIGYLIFLLVIGYFSGRKLKTPREFALSDRPFSLVTMVATLFASFFAGTNLFGVPERICKVGVIFFICFLGNAVNLWLVAKTMIDPVVKYRDAVTLGDIAHDMYGKFGRILVGVCTVLACAGVVGAQMAVIGVIGRDFLHIDSNLAVAIGCCILIMYSSFGGVKAVAFTDVLQFFVFAVILPMIVGILLHKVGNLWDLWNALPETHKTICRADSWNYFVLFLFYCCPVFDPPFMQRILVMGERGRETARKAFVIVSVLVILYSILLGILGACAALIPNINPESAFWTLVESSLPTGMKGVLAIAILAVTMSFADSYLNVGGVSFTRDILKNTFFPSMSDKTELRLMRGTTVFFGIAAYFIGTSFSDLIEIIIYTNNFWMPVLVIPLYFTFYGLKISTRLFVLASACAAFITWYWMTYMPNDLGVESIAAGMIVDLLVLVVGYWYERKNHKMIFAKNK